MKRAYHYFCLILTLVVGSGCVAENRNNEKDYDEKEITDTVAQDDEITGILLEKADSLISGLSLEEKAAQTLMPAIYASEDFYTLKVINEYGKMGVGGVVLLKGASHAAKVISDSLFHSGSISPFVAIDAEWGLAMRLTDARRFPANSELPDSTSEEEMFLYGAELAKECREIGINMVLGPVVDVAPRESYMRRRSLGEDPTRVSELSVAYARGLESAGVMSVAKHFPGHGSVKGDSHKSKPVISKTLHEMDSIDLYPFRRYVEEGLSAVMVGHLAFPAIDSEMLPSAVSRSVITGLLKEDLGFEGLVLTDALNMKGAEGNGAEAALLAGADIVLAPRDTRQAVKEIMEAVKEGRLRESRLDSIVRKIIFYKLLKER